MMWELLTNAECWFFNHRNHSPLTHSSLGSNSSTTLSGSSYPFLFTVGTYSLPLPETTASIISGPSRVVNHRIINLKPYQVAQGHGQSNLENLQGQRL